MPLWKVRPIGSFREDFLKAMELGPGDYVLQRSRMQTPLKKEQRHWAVFLYSLRNSPTSPLHPFVDKFRRRTYVRFNPLIGAYELQLTVRETAEALLSEAQILDDEG